MPRTRFVNKKDDASEVEGASEFESELSSDERGYAKVVEAQDVDFIDDHSND